MKSGFWPVTVVVVAFLSAITIILITTPETDQATRSIALVLITTLTSLLSAVWVNKRNEQVTDEVKAQVAEVKHQVNGRMTEALAKIPDAPCQHCQGHKSDPPAAPTIEPIP